MNLLDLLSGYNIIILIFGVLLFGYFFGFFETFEQPKIEDNNNDSDVFLSSQAETDHESESVPKTDFTLGVDTNDPEYKKLGGISNIPKLTSKDLLPKKGGDDHFKTPSVKGTLEDATLLANAEFKIGINTIGNSRKSMTLDPRGPVAVPRINAGPFNRPTRDPDTSLGWCDA